jgi:hypothetical protein
MIDMFGSVIAGVVALGLFAWAWGWNNNMQDSKAVGYICVFIAVLGSVVLYASALAMWVSGKAVSLVNAIGGMIGAGSMAPWVMGFLCFFALGLTVVDLWKEPEHNPRAVAMLVMAPIAAHGTSNGMHTAMEVVYGGLSLGTLDALQNWFGGIA